MSVVAYLVLGKDGSSTFHGTSAGITSALDRESFLEARRGFDCILIGGQSARVEPYAKTPVPLVIVSRTPPPVLEENQRAHWWNCRPGEAIPRAVEIFGPNICVEGGINFLNELLSENLIDELHLSVTQATGGENKVDIQKLLNQFTEVTQTFKDDTIFYLATSPIATKPR